MPKEKQFTLMKLLVAAPETVDSVKIDKNGEFEFKGESNFSTYYSCLNFKDNRLYYLAC